MSMPHWHTKPSPRVPSLVHARALQSSQLSLQSNLSQPVHSLRPPLHQRAATFLRENPYTRFSLTLCGVVLSLSLGFELYKKFKRKKAPEVVLMPPHVGHFTVQRTNDLAAITRRLQSLRRHATEPTILYLVGPPGAGKSELAYQYAEQFANSGQSRLRKTQQPVVLYLNGATDGLLEATLREAAMSVGVKQSELSLTKEPSAQRVKCVAKALRSKLSAGKQQWLMVVDGLSSETLPAFTSAFCRDAVKGTPEVGKGLDWAQGAVLVTARGSLPLQTVHNESTMELAAGMGQGLGVQLLKGMVGQTVEEAEANRLVECLQSSPLAIALAAATINIYHSCLEEDPTSLPNSPLTDYTEILTPSLPPHPQPEDVQQAALTLYTEAAVSIPRVRHTFDLLGTCDMHYPIPAIVIAHHLSHPFYRLPPLTPPPFPSPSPPTKEEGTSTIKAYLQQLKAMFPFMNSSPTGTSQSDLDKYLKALEDQVPFIRDCPLLSFKKYHKTGMELVNVHPFALTHLPQLFSKYTAPGLDRDHLKQAEDDFNRTAWFRRYRVFDPSHSLQAYNRSLPGLSAVGILTESQFENTHCADSPGTPSTYGEYVHLVSHSHRVISSLAGVLKSLGGDVEDSQLKTYLQPHFRAASSLPFVSKTDKLTCSYSLASIEAFLSSTEEYPEAVQKFNTVLDQQRSLLGSGHPAVARTLTDIADLKFSLNDISGARQLLESAMAIYEKLPRESLDKHAMDIGLSLASLGLVLNSLGERRQSCQLLEQALGHYQVVQPGENVTKNQQKLVASTLIDVAHTYLSLGDINNAKKYIDLANLATRNVYKEAHPETIRALNVMSMVYALLGDKPESHRVRQEAGKFKNQLDTKPLAL